MSHRHRPGISRLSVPLAACYGMLTLGAPEIHGQVEYEFAGRGVALGDTLDIPHAEVGQVGSAPFKITNTSSTTTVTVRVDYPGGRFSVPNRCPSHTFPPLASCTFDLSFQPEELGPGRGFLTLDGQDSPLRSRGLVPRDRIRISPTGIVEPGQQPRARLTLSPAFPTKITGRLILSPTSDPAVMFETGLDVPFEIAENSTDAIFQGERVEIGFQTGTVAGDLKFRAEFAAEGSDVTPAPNQEFTAVVQPIAPRIQSARIESSTSTLTLVLVAYSTPRNMTRVSLVVNPTSGASADQNTSDLGPNTSEFFRSYYESPEGRAAGSLFELRVPGTFTGSLAALRSITVTLENAAGPSERREVLVSPF